MKKFTKGNLETVVEDNDRRIPEYLANGWKEAAPNKAPNGEQSATDKALNDVANSEGTNDTPSDKNGRGAKVDKAGKPNKTSQKVNDAIAANSNAATEGEAVDDGLEEKGGD